MIGIIFLSIKCKQLSWQDSVIEFRKVQILEKVLNVNIKGPLFPVTMGTLPAVQIFTGFVIIKLNESPDMDWVKVAMFSLVYFEVLLFNLISVSAAASAFILTGEWLQGQRSRGAYYREKKRYWASCVPLSLQFGTNFVDRLTPLRVQEYCLFVCLLAFISRVIQPISTKLDWSS